jgi:hypothetical protein
MLLIFMLPYGWPIGLPALSAWLGAWKFVLATPLLMICAALFFKKNWTTVLGFPKSLSQIIACVIIGILAFVVFYFFIEFVLSYAGYQQLPFTPSAFFGSYPLLCRTLWRICQPLNEEIILRALLVGFFACFFSHRVYVAIIPALVFSGLHLLIYYFGEMDVRLDLSALLTLFFFALTANALYLTFNHIAFGFVIHLAWNWWRFSGDIVKDGLVLNEAQTFNALEGSSVTLIFVSVLSLLFFVALAFMKFKTRNNAKTFKRTAHWG